MNNKVNDFIKATNAIHGRQIKSLDSLLEIEAKTVQYCDKVAKLVFKKPGIRLEVFRSGFSIFNGDDIYTKMFTRNINGGMVKGLHKSYNADIVKQFNEFVPPPMPQKVIHQISDDARTLSFWHFTVNPDVTYVSPNLTLKTARVIGVSNIKGNRIVDTSDVEGTPYFVVGTMTIEGAVFFYHFDGENSVIPAIVNFKDDNYFMGGTDTNHVKFGITKTKSAVDAMKKLTYHDKLLLLAAVKCWTT